VISVVTGLVLAFRRRRHGLGQLPPGIHLGQLPPDVRPPVVQVGRLYAFEMPPRGGSFGPPGLRLIPARRRVRAKGFKLRLTRNQFEKLFPGVGRLPRDVWPRARCGMFGCVYPRGPEGTSGAREVIKFTADAREALAAARLQRDPAPGSIPILELHKLLPHPYKREWEVPHERRVWAIRTRRFDPSRVARMVGVCAEGTGYPSQLADVRLDFLRCVDEESARRKISPERATKFAVSTIEAVRALWQRGILWHDLHRGNLMQDAAGEPVIIDVGAAEKIIDPGREDAPPMLERPR
jgi:hypothetical protein